MSDVGWCARHPAVAFKVDEAIAQGEFERGILICGTGIGMAISANKVPGVYAALGHDMYSAERAQEQQCFRKDASSGPS